MKKDFISTGEIKAIEPFRSLNLYSKYEYNK